MTRLRAVALALALGCALPASASAGGAGARVPDGGIAAAPREAPFGRTSLLSKARDGSFPAGRSDSPVMSANGRWVVFSSLAPDLVADDEAGSREVFVLDRRDGRIRRAPLPDGFARNPNASGTSPTISADGSVVAWVYTPPVAVGAAVGGFGSYVFAWDRDAARAEVVSRNPGGGQQRGASHPSLSADGRYVAYQTTYDWPDDNDGDRADVIRFDRRRDRSVLVSVSPEGGPIGGSADSPSISGDGNLVAFVSDGNDTVVHESTGKGGQVYVRDVAAKRTQRVSKASDGGAANSEAIGPVISGNGRYVAFSSSATNLTAQAQGGLFRRDLRAGRTDMVSVRPDGAGANGASVLPSITPDGRYVAWTATATDLVPETLGRIAPAATSRFRAEVFLRDMSAGETILISVARDGTPGGGQSYQPSVAGGGRFVAFAGDSPVLVRGDGNDQFDVFLRDLPPVPAITPGALDLGGRPVDTTSPPLAATLTNRGWSALAVTGSAITGANRKDFDVVADGCKAARLERDGSCTVTVTFTPAAPGARTATLEVRDTFAGSPRTVRLRGRASQATLALDPPIGPPGFVTIASGSGFPHNTKVVVRWSIGITPTFHTLSTDKNGVLRVPVLVFHNDVTGPRELRVSPADGSAFPAVSATMLVVKPSVAPPRFDPLRILDLPLVLVIRG
jgi:Tol biopolymer transport system component